MIIFTHEGAHSSRGSIYSINRMEYKIKVFFLKYIHLIYCAFLLNIIFISPQNCQRNIKKLHPLPRIHLLVLPKRHFFFLTLKTLKISHTVVEAGAHFLFTLIKSAHINTHLTNYK